MAPRYLSLLALALPILPAVFGAASDLDVQTVQAQFQASGISGNASTNLIPTFDPQGILRVNFSGVGEIKPGQAITMEQSGPVPSFSFEPTSAAASRFAPSGTNSTLFTICMLDADVVGTDESNGVNRHFLQNGIGLDNGNNGSFPISNRTAAITPYAGPGPAAGSGPHRYVVLLYTQPDNFTAPETPAQGSGVDRMDWTGYVRNTGLGNVVAGTFFTVSNGETTVSVSATPTVNPATLPAATASRTGTPSASGSAGASASSRPNSAARMAGSSGVVGVAGAVVAAAAAMFVF